jgi:hypothetical protein
MRLEWIARDINSGFDGGNAIVDDHSDRHLAQTHSKHLEQPDRGVREPRPEPKIEEPKDNDAEDKNDQGSDCNDDEVKGLHGGRLAEAIPRWKFIWQGRRELPEVGAAFASRQSGR